MTTTEPLKKLTLDKKKKKYNISIYDENFKLKKTFSKPLLILTYEMNDEINKKLKDKRKYL